MWKLRGERASGPGWFRATVPSQGGRVEEIREELLAACAPITPRSGGVPFYSTVTGGLLDTSELDGEYWYRNTRETVRFEEVTGALLARGHRVFVEVSPHPVLTVGVQETVDGVFGDPGEVLVSGSLRSAMMVVCGVLFLRLLRCGCVVWVLIGVRCLLVLVRMWWRCRVMRFSVSVIG